MADHGFCICDRGCPECMPEPIDLPPEAIIEEPVTLPDSCVLRSIEIPVRGRGRLVATLSACDRQTLTVRVDGEGEAWWEAEIDAALLRDFLLSLPPAPEQIAHVASEAEAWASGDFSEEVSERPLPSGLAKLTEQYRDRPLTDDEMPF